MPLFSESGKGNRFFLPSFRCIS